MPWLTVRQVLRLLDISSSTLYRLEKAGKLTPYRDHRGVRHFKVEEVERLRQQREPKSAEGLS